MHRLPNIRTSGLLRSAFAALLLSCVFVASIGEFVAIKIIQWNIRREVAASIRIGLPEDNLALIKISNQNPPESFVRIEKHEFRYQNGSYDIVREEIRGDSTYFYCVYDERETMLYANMDQRIVDEMSHNPERQQQRIQLLGKIPKLYFVEQEDIPSFDIRFGKSQIIHIFFLSAQFEPTTPTPPPDVV